MSQAKKPTTYDVAERANVSQMTVSRVLRNKGYVSEAVREKVLNAAEEIGYVRNTLAGSFAEQSSNLIGAIIPSLSNSVFTDVLSGVEDVISQSVLQLAISVSHYDQQREYALVKDMLAWRPAAMVLTGIEHDPRTRQLLQRNNINTIEMMDVDGDPIAKCVGLSQRAAGRAMAEHLLQRGYKRFGYVGCELDIDTRAAKRRAAFEEALAQQGFAPERTALASEPSSMQLGRQLTAQVLKDNRQPIALYYSNDDLAAGGLLYCSAQGLSVPDEVALAGHNGLAFLDAMPMRITTFDAPRYEIGQIVGRYLLGETDDTVTRLAGELIIGNTT